MREPFSMREVFDGVDILLGIVAVAAIVPAIFRFAAWVRDYLDALAYSRQTIATAAEQPKIKGRYAWFGPPQ